MKRLFLIVLTIAATTAEARLVCTPKQLGAKSVLRLRMNVPHGGELAIVTPKKEYLFVIHDEVPSPLMTTAQFRETAELRIDPRTAKGKPWIVGRDPELVFVTRGWYTIVVGEPLESEDDSAESCKVFFAGAK